MDTWEIAVVAVVPTVCLAILAAAIGCLYKRYWQRKRSQVETTKTGYTNHMVQGNVDSDVESQRRATSHDESETRNSNGNLSPVTVIDEENIASGSAIGAQSDKGRSLITIINEESVHPNFGKETIMGKGHLSHGIHIDKERVQHNFQSATTIGQDNFSSFPSINEPNTNSNESRTRFLEQRAAQRLENPNIRVEVKPERETVTIINESRASFIEQRAAKILENLNFRLEVKPAWESVSPSRSQQEKVHSNLHSTNVQNQAQTKATHRPAVTLDTRHVQNFTNVQNQAQTKAIHRPAVTLDTRHVQNFTNVQNQAQTKATHRPAVTHDTRHVQNFTNASRSNFDTSTGYPQLDLHFYRLKDAMAVFKNFLQESITEYRLSNYSRNRRFILVITGRGKHSPGGIPVIKPAVENYLYTHDYTYNWSNPGLVRIDLLSERESDNSD